MTDKTLPCCDCGREFVFTVAEQEFFAQRGYTNTPKRCVECRKRRRRKGRQAPHDSSVGDEDHVRHGTVRGDGARGRRTALTATTGCGTRAAADRAATGRTTNPARAAATFRPPRAT